MSYFEYIKGQKNHPVKFALFDFDGTISLIREGWQNIMIPYFIDVIQQTGTDEAVHEIENLVTEFVDKLTGKQTIFQCMQLAEEVRKRNTTPLDPYEYKKEYLRRLDQVIANRKDDLKTGKAAPSQYLVTGIEKLLNELNDMGINCYLASGTDEKDVLEEAALLHIDQYFNNRIFGARDEILTCSKELVIQNIIKENHISGAELVSFGDGYVEIELVANIGGLAVGIASDEKNIGQLNEWKRKRLIEAGASLILADFTNVSAMYSLIRS